MARRQTGCVAPFTDSPHRRRGEFAPIVLVDNYDSFTQNLAHRLAEAGADVRVVRHDEATVRDVIAARPSGVVVSPGPRSPREAGISVPVIVACARARPAVPVLGVCLGHQAIGVAFGGRVTRARAPVHGRATDVVHRGLGVLAGLRCPLRAARYHSLVIDPESLPDGLVVHATSIEGDIMGVMHRSLPIEGVQFHPESFLTPDGPRMLAAFVRRCTASTVSAATAPASAVSGTEAVRKADGPSRARISGAAARR